LLGLKVDVLLLTDSISNGKAQYKATMFWKESCAIPHNLNSNFDTLSFISHFDVLSCNVHSSHFEQLAIACPNITELDIQNNPNCLKNLQVPHVIAAQICVDLIYL